jgi:hypothetical protein
VTYAEFLEAVGRMREVGFPIGRDPGEARPDFVGWRVNYEPGAAAVVLLVYGVTFAFTEPPAVGCRCPKSVSTSGNSRLTSRATSSPRTT